MAKALKSALFFLIFTGLIAMEVWGFYLATVLYGQSRYLHGAYSCQQTEQQMYRTAIPKQLEGLTLGEQPYTGHI